jgi:DNA replication and repair protein RecF
LRLVSLRVEGFRNLEAQDVSFSAPVTLVYGDNAQGKTNLLEAIYLLGTTRSFRENSVDHLIREGAESAALSGEVERFSVTHCLDVELDRDGRRYRRDGGNVPLPEYLGVLPAVAVTASDRTLVTGQPGHRRQYLDSAAVWCRPSYLDTLQAFGRCRRERTQALREYEPRRRDELEAWDEVFLRLGVEIREERARVVERTNAELARESDDLDLGEELALRYRPSGGNDLPSALKGARRAELERGHCLVGPHRDAVEIQLGGRPIEVYGSSGQARSALWMLKLAMVRLIAAQTGEPPLFLLDDAEAELDEGRLKRLLRLTGQEMQVVMTACRPIGEMGSPMARFHMKTGKLSEENGGPEPA